MVTANAGTLVLIVTFAFGLFCLVVLMLITIAATTKHYRPLESREEEEDKELMTANYVRERCPECSAIEIHAWTARTVYECGSSDYDQREGTFKQSDECKLRCFNREGSK